MAKPLLKWAGGKRWIVPLLLPIIKKFGDVPLVELFAGGAALSFTLEPEEVILNDKNPHLINFYRQVQKGVDIFSLNIEFKNDEKVFYKNREMFNELIERGKEKTPQAAALFYYLNKTSYNGLMRFNSKGLFNTPFGRYAKINYTFDISFYSTLLKKWTFTNKDFCEVDIPSNAIIYADPPYDVEFTHYNAGGFDWSEQVRLVKYLSTLSNPLILSNQATKKITDLYTSFGFYITFHDSMRVISSKGKNRKKTVEVIAYKNISPSILI